MTRAFYQDQLDQLHEMLLKMEVSIEEAIDMTITALKNMDAHLAQVVVDHDDLIDDQEMEIENFCINLLITQQPVAGDMREITSILKMITDLERIADQCVDICHYLIKMELQEKPLFLEKVIQLAYQVRKMFCSMMQSYIDKDSSLAVATAKSDDAADQLFRQISNDIVDTMLQSGNKQIVYFILIGKYLERMADHITNVCEWVNFRLTGEHEQFN